MTTETTLQRRPIRGLVWGLVMGLGVGLLLMVLSIVQLSIINLAFATGVGGVSGLVWGTIGPPKKPKGAAPGTGDPSAHVLGSPTDPTTADETNGE